MQSCLAITCAVALGVLSFQPRVQPVTGWTFASFQSQLTQLLYRVAPDSEEGKSLSNSLDSLMNLQARFTQKYGDDADTEKTIMEKLPSFYSETVRNDIEALQDLPKGAAARLLTLRMIETDLKDKETAVGSGLNLEHTFPATITVRVSLRKSAPSGTDPASLSIHVNSCLRGNRDKGHEYHANKETVDFPLPPGCFVFWLEMVDGKNLNPIPIRQDIGHSTQKPEVVPLFF